MKRSLVSAICALALPLTACGAGHQGSGGPGGPGGKADDTSIADGEPFIDSQTFANGVGCGFERSGSEIEATYTVSGIDGKELREILVSPAQGSERSVFRRVRKNRDLEAFAYGYDLDEIPWSRSKHRIREDFPYVTLTIERGRFDPDPDSGEREISLGTDIMDDAYFDTSRYEMLDNAMTLRGRIRWDGPGVVRRLLVAAKFNTTVDDNGIKRSEKVDTRTTGGTHAGTLFDDVRSGEVPWCGGRQAIEPIRIVYDRLAELGILPDLHDSSGALHEDVLLIQPRVHLRSTRSRLHYDYAPTSDVRRFYTNALDRIRDARDDADTELLDPGFDDRYVSAADADAARQRVQAVIDGAEGILSGESIRAAVQATDPNLGSITLPDAFPNAVGSFEALEANRVTAEVTSEVFHDFADILDDADRDISGAPANDTDASEALEDLGDILLDWQDAQRQELARARTVRPHLAHYRGMSAAERQSFADFYLAEMTDNGVLDPDAIDPLDDAIWAQLGDQLELESLKVSQRMIEAGGTASQGLWFEQARDYYVPQSNRPFGNFLIDTIDMAEIVLPHDWEALDPAVRDQIDVPLPHDIVAEAMLVNEVQIELQLEQPYIERINALSELVDAGTASAEDLRNLEGAQFVLDTLMGAQTRVAELKEDHIEDVLEDNGVPNNSLVWEPVEQSKGVRALTLAREMAPPVVPPPEDCGIHIVEVAYDLDGADDRREWIKLYNSCSSSRSLDNMSLGWGGASYTRGVADLSGSLGAKACVVVGGADAAPSGDLEVNFTPNLQNSGAIADGVGLFDMRSTAVTETTVPVDAVIYGESNDDALLDADGGTPEPHVGDARPGQTIFRTAAGDWEVGDPRPTACPSF